MLHVVLVAPRVEQQLRQDWVAVNVRRNALDHSGQYVVVVVLGMSWKKFGERIFLCENSVKELHICPRVTEQSFICTDLLNRRVPKGPTVKDT